MNEDPFSACKPALGCQSLPGCVQGELPAHVRGTKRLSPWGSQVSVGPPASVDMVELPNEDLQAEHLPEIR